MQSAKPNQPVLSSITLIGLGLSLLMPVVHILVINPLFLKPGINEPLLILLNFGVLWGLALGVLLFTHKVEKRPLSSIGWQPLSLKWTFIAIGIGVLLSLLVPVLTLLVTPLFPPTDTGTVTDVSSRFPWWILLLSVLTAGVTEEILFRGYPLERLLSGTNKTWLSAGISLIFFVAVHAAGWNLAHIVGVVLPLGAALTGLYLWRRNLLFVMIVHLVIDLPLVILSLLA